MGHEMRIAVISDIHGNLLALEAVLRDIAFRQIDIIANLGDSLSGPLQPLETATVLMGQPWVQLAGNHERQLMDFSSSRRGPSDQYTHSLLNSEVFEWMANLRPAQALNEEVFLCHGTPRSDVEYFLETVEASGVRPATTHEIEERLGQLSAAVVLCGHTHIPRIVRFRTDQLLVNPGSVGLQAFQDDIPNHHVVENHSPDARYAIVEKQGGTWQADLLAVPYDFTSAAELARQRGRDDWEVALRYGFINEPDALIT